MIHQVISVDHQSLVEEKSRIRYCPVNSSTSRVHDTVSLKMVRGKKNEKGFFTRLFFPSTNTQIHATDSRQSVILAYTASRSNTRYFWFYIYFLLVFSSFILITAMIFIIYSFFLISSKFSKFKQLYYSIISIIRNGFNFRL